MTSAVRGSTIQLKVFNLQEVEVICYQSFLQVNSDESTFQHHLTRMPGIPLVARETTYSRSADQMCRQGSSTNLSDEEEIAAQESLSKYCKPVEFYNILRRRAVNKPYFLQRSLRYKIQSKHKRRIQMTVNLLGILSDGLQTQSSFPLYILLARPVPKLVSAEYPAVYRFKRACTVVSSASAEGTNRAHANFILPEINEFEKEVKFGSLVILLINCANVEGVCLFGMISMELLHMAMEKSPNMDFGERAEVMSTVDMRSHMIKLHGADEDKYIAVQMPHNSGDVVMHQQAEVIISAEEVGAKEISPYDLYTYNDIPASSLSHIIRLRTGNVIFNYKYFNNQLRRTEVTEDFCCPFCLVKCASFKGLRFHLLSSHELFNFEFWVTAEHQVVDVSIKTDMEVVSDGVDPKQLIFFHCSKPLRRRKPRSLVRNARHMNSLLLNSEFPIAIDEHQSKAEDPECFESVPGSNAILPAMLQFAKTRKLSAECSNRRNRSLLQKRQFFHSHRAQPMAVEQVLSDRDSEDEVDDDVADFEDRRLLDDFVDVSKDEKQMMHLWNSFIRKQRVLADGHIPWTCEAFSKLHGQDLVQAPQLLWCWRLFMIKLWNHGLLDARTMNNCNKTLEQCQYQGQSLSINPDPLLLLLC